MRLVGVALVEFCWCDNCWVAAFGSARSVKRLDGHGGTKDLTACPVVRSSEELEVCVDRPRGRGWVQHLGEELLIGCDFR